MKVNFIAERSKTVTGLGRYSSTIIRFLEKQGITTTVQFTDPNLPALITKLSQQFGYDIARFTGHYPVRLPKVEASLHHITSESLATVLRFQRIEPVVITTHGPLTYLLRHHPEMSIKTHLLDRAFEDIGVKAFQKADHLITDSQFLAGFWVDDLRIASDRVSVVHLGIDHELFRVKTLSDEFLATYHLQPSDYRYIVYTGSEQPRKNFLTLVEAFGMIHSEFPNTRLLKIGNPEIMAEREKARKRIQELELEDAVQFIGYVPEEDLVSFYNIADVFVFPSRYEGFGLPPLEAMACGAPVISSAATSLAEVVGDGALIFDPLNTPQLVEALRRLLTNEDERQALRERGLKRSQQFTWEKTASETMQVYEKVLAQRKASE